MFNRHNNFGTLRLAFASLVIASHTPEMLDGNRSRELVNMLFGTMTFGSLAVSGFFLISGFLITRSMAEGRSLLSFSARRIGRIVPGFMVAFWLSLLVMGPFVTPEPVFTSHVLLSNIVLAAKLDMPWAPGVFPSNHYHALNGAMWTIAWEFLCYIGIAILGTIGLLKARFRWLILAGVVAMMIVHAVWTAIPTIWNTEGDLRNLVRFSAVFGAGAAFYLFRDKVKYTHRGAALAAVALFGLMFLKPLAEPALAIFGGYLIFWFAFAVKQLRLSRVRNDLSYGIYLYGWPVGQLLIWAWPQGNPWLLGFATLVGAAVLGFLSWKLVEQPSMKAVDAWLVSRKAKAALAIA